MNQYVYDHFRFVGKNSSGKGLPRIGALAYTVSETKTADGVEFARFWETESLCPIWFPLHDFERIKDLEELPVGNLDEMEVKALNRRHMFRIDKMFRMGGRVSSTLMGYENGWMDLEISSSRTDCFSGSKVADVFLNISSAWRHEPELQRAKGFRARVSQRLEKEGLVHQMTILYEFASKGWPADLSDLPRRNGIPNFAGSPRA